MGMNGHAGIRISERLIRLASNLVRCSNSRCPVSIAVLLSAVFAVCRFNVGVLGIQSDYFGEHVIIISLPTISTKC